MPHRVSTTERIRGHIDELFAQDKSLPEILEQVARLGAQLLMQAALEAEITEQGRNGSGRTAETGNRSPVRWPTLSVCVPWQWGMNSTTSQLHDPPSRVSSVKPSPEYGRAVAGGTP